MTSAEELGVVSRSERETRFEATPTIVFACHAEGLEITRHLLARDQAVGVVVVDDEPLLDDYSAAVEGSRASLILWSDLPSAESLARNFDEVVVLSAFFAYRIPMTLIDHAIIGVNLHPGFLPVNRGRGASMWSIINDTPAGISAHLMTSAFDEGDILWRVEVPRYGSDTGDTLTARVLATGIQKFRDTWPRFLTNEGMPQTREQGSYFSSDDCERVTLSPGDFATFDKLRAKTYQGNGITFLREGVRYRARIEVERMADNP